MATDRKEPEYLFNKDSQHITEEHCIVGQDVPEGVGEAQDPVSYGCICEYMVHQIGGPIVHPSVDSFIITPICPHTLSDRPVVVSDTSIIEVKLSAGTESVFLTLDGQKGIPLQATDRVRVSRAQQRLKLIQTPNKSYFEILRNKLKWGEA